MSNVGEGEATYCRKALISFQKEKKIYEEKEKVLREKRKDLAEKRKSTQI